MNLEFETGNSHGNDEAFFNIHIHIKVFSICYHRFEIYYTKILKKNVHTINYRKLPLFKNM